MRQCDIFIHGEADRWLERNRAGLGTHDPVMEIMQELDIRPEYALEIGCSNGWRLNALREKYSCEIMGIEPGHAPGMEAAKLRVPVFGATAAALPVLGRMHDVVIYGFCLYLVDPVDWFKVVAEGDRVLKENGYLIIHDFAAYEYAFGRTYEHCDGVTAYHVDFSQFWLANPLYELVQRTTLEGDEMVTVLRKLPLDSLDVLP